ncbi:unnamed protein product [Callosobruchus maculatus]|uniref:Uncharacterized protein n=1 Tax=Callosobruchus maculatus TaxID=64391 RepID=A0A653C7E3_CALMS|nr:unnamed protein product [Callosobruchus maculatus]
MIFIACDPSSIGEELVSEGCLATFIITKSELQMAAAGCHPIPLQMTC